MNLFPNPSLFLGLSTSSGIRRVIGEPWEGYQETELDNVPRAATSVNDHPSSQTRAISAAALFNTRVNTSSAFCVVSGFSPSAPESCGSFEVGSTSPERQKTPITPSPSSAEHCEELHIGESLRVSRTRSAVSLTGPFRSRLASAFDGDGSSSPLTRTETVLIRTEGRVGGSGFRAQSYNASSETRHARGAVGGSTTSKASICADDATGVGTPHQTSPQSPRSGASPPRRLSGSVSRIHATPPCERLLHQRQQQRKLQQQGTLASFPTLSSCSSVDDCAEHIGARRLRLVRNSYLGDEMSPPTVLESEHDQQQNSMGVETSDNGGNVIPEAGQGASDSEDSSCEATGPPALSRSLRLQLLQEVMCSNNPTSSGRSEKKWWSMDDRNLEEFIFAHHQTFIRRLKRYAYKPYKWGSRGLRELESVAWAATPDKPKGFTARLLALSLHAEACPQHTGGERGRQSVPTNGLSAGK